MEERVGISDIFWCSPRKLGKFDIFWHIFFQMGWFNHQPVTADSAWSWALFQALPETNPTSLPPEKKA